MELEVIDAVGSTMDAARENVLKGRVAWNEAGQAVPGGVLALAQTAGRGQRGREWFAQRGESLSATYYLSETALGADGFRFLPILAGIAVSDALSEALGSSRQRAPDHPDLGLKWPNDLLLNGKKVGGILIEAVKLPDGGRVALVGVGVNLGLFAFPPELASLATSFALENLPIPDPVELGLHIGRSLQQETSLYSQSGATMFLDRWRGLDQTVGRVYETEWNGQPVQGTAVGVNDAGELVLRLKDGREVAVVSASTVRERL